MQLKTSNEEEIRLFACMRFYAFYLLFVLFVLFYV